MRVGQRWWDSGGFAAVVGQWGVRNGGGTVGVRSGVVTDGWKSRMHQENARWRYN